MEEDEEEREPPTCRERTAGSRLAARRLQQEHAERVVPAFDIGRERVGQRR